MMSVTSYLLCGVGGQGTVLASKLLAYCGMKAGMHVRTSETIGMAQRGGCVVSHVRIGTEIHSPLISPGQADMIIAFEPAEAARALPYLKPNGAVVVNRKAVKPVTSSLSGQSYDGEEMLSYLSQQIKQFYPVDGDAICSRCGSQKVLNIALLAAAAKTNRFLITPDELRAAVTERMPERFHAMNLQAIDEVTKL